MVFYQLSEKAKLRRQRTNEAIALAMQSRWEEAVAVNKSIIEVFPDDADAYNRLGKALTQLGIYVEAREAYSRALEIDPNNGIAKKNLDRLGHLKEIDTDRANGKQVSSHLFIEETGKADVTEIHQLAPPKVLARVAAGDTVNLKPRGGNKYSAAIASIGSGRGRVMIKEVYQHPSQVGRPSFPARAADGFRPYVKDSMLKYEREADDEDNFDEDYPSEPEREEPVREEVTSLEEIAALNGEDDEEAELELKD
jgi:hypothetical protein